MYYGRLDRHGTLKHSPVSVKRLLYSESMLPGLPTHAQPGKTIHMDMRKIARIGRGKHQKAWEQEIRREHNSNPLQRHSHARTFLRDVLV